LLNISSVSRLFYADSDILAMPHTVTIYFEFNQHDSRYNNISSLLLYLLNAFAWRFWEIYDHTMLMELKFLSHTHSWSLEDLYHLYSTLRASITSDSAGRGLTIFISCFDQCPADQRQWFLERVLEEQSYNDSEDRLILSTLARDDLAVASFPDEARINLDRYPAHSVLRDSLTEELRSGLNALVAKRPIYEDFRPQLESLLEQCGDASYLGRIILTWLGIHHRGKPRSEIADKISKLSPPTAENVVRLFIVSLVPTLRTRVETVFNWVKIAAEPWSPESLTEALVVRELDGGEPTFEDLDVQGTMSEIEEACGGIIALIDGDVKFSHPSFYQVPELGFEETGAEAAARANSTLAETCLRYLQLSCAQEALTELSLANLSPEGGPWETPVNSALISRTRTNMAEYAVRFWHQHYKSSGKFKPRELVDGLFTNKGIRAGWEVSFWLLSNPFTRMQRCYTSTLPVLAMLGLEDLVHEKVQNEKGQPTFEKDCWYAIAEAARAGHEAMVQQLLGEVAVDEKELQTALHWASGRGDASTVSVLLARIPNLETFHWPDNMMHRATAAGLDDLLAAMLLSGLDINETTKLYLDMPPVAIAALRKRVSTLEILLSSKPKLDLAIESFEGLNPLLLAAIRGHPRITELLVQNGAYIEVNNGDGRRPVQLAAQRCNHKAMGVLIKAGVDFKSGGDEYNRRSPLIIAAESGSQECVRVLLAHGADPNVECDGVTALYEAVAGDYPSVAQELLSHDPKPNMERIGTGYLTLLMRAICTEDAELVGVLLDHGAEMHFVDPNGGDWSKTPLAEACVRGCLDIAKALLEKGADINYFGEDTLDSPLFLALNSSEPNPELVRLLLQDETLDVKRAAADGSTALVSFPLPFWIFHMLISGELLARSVKAKYCFRAAQKGCAHRWSLHILWNGAAQSRCGEQAEDHRNASCSY
jgi:ankyrin repeat protein